MEINNELNMNTKIMVNHYHNYIYNIKEGKYPFLLQFKQLKYYYNMNKEFKNKVFGCNPQEDENKEINPESKVFQNMFSLIDRKWLKKWKKHVGYKEIKNKIKEDKMERNLDNNDYKWISEIIDKNYKENYLNSYDNNAIYEDNEINPLSDFKVIHKDCLKFFNINSKNPYINNNFRKYPLRLFKNKYILILNNHMLYIVFRNINSQKIKEIFVDFIENGEKNKEDNKSQNKANKSSKKKFIDILFKGNINDWLKEINFNNEIEKELEYNNCKIRIYNKALLREVEETQMRNSKFPNINNDERNELLNSNSLSNGLTKIGQIQEKANQFMIRDRKSIDNNNNNESIITEMVLESIKENNKKPSIINLNIGEKHKNNNDIKGENNNNQKIDELNCKSSRIINRANIDKNFDGQFPNSNQKIGYDNKNKSEFKDNQINNFVKNQCQENFPQNQNNNFNCHNNQNNNNNNYNIQNQMQFYNNNASQNNNNQGLFQNNNIINYNIQQNNRLANFNNSQSNKIQQNNFPINCNQNMQFNNNNSEFNNMQFNNFINNNQNNNFNYNNNQKISQNDKNNNINNYNIQNQIQCNNNNIIQNNNYQNLFGNNNKLMNNNFNNQQNNNIFNSNNMQNNKNQQNSLQTKLILMEEDKKNIENMKNKEINELKKKINELKDELKKEKDKNKLLEQNIINLDNLKKELNEEINKNKDMKKSIEMKNIYINELNQIIVEKEKKINILEKKLSRFPFELEEDEQLMSVIFTTLDQKFHYSIICKNTDIFNTIENKLYNAFYEYSETENYFFVNGGKINKVKTLEYNKIKNNDLIILNQIDEI